MKATQRMVPLDGGKRAGVKLDEPTWQAVDWLAQQQGKTWQQWCAAIIAAAPGDDGNRTAAVRAAAMDGLLMSTVFEDRAIQLDAMASHPLMRDSASLNDQQLESILSRATVDGWSDFGGFAVGFGRDEYGQPCVWVKNGLRNHLHFAFIAPNN